MTKLNPKKKLVFVFIGTDKHYVDSIAPRIGNILKQRGTTHRIMFCDQSQIEETKKEICRIKREFPKQYQFVAVDVGFCSCDSKYVFSDEGLKPSSAIKKQTKVIGDCSVIINIDKCYVGNLQEKKLKLMENYIDRYTEKQIKKIIKYTSMGLDRFIRVCRTHEKK